jgi:crossover junction endodeoxyribonuclease RusA
MIIEIPDLQPTVNHCYKRRKNKRLYLSDEGESYKDLVKSCALSVARREKWQMIKAGKFIHIAISFELINRKFSDPNNLVKLTIDAFQGILYENDKWVLPLIWDARITGRMYTHVMIKREGEYFTIPELMDSGIT